MPLENIVIPEFKEKSDYHGVMAKLIAANNHDLVIEVATSLLETEHKWPETLLELRSVHSWKGRYVTVNVDTQPYFVDGRKLKQGNQMPEYWYVDLTKNPNSS